MEWYERHYRRLNSLRSDEALNVTFTDREGRNIRKVKVSERSRSMFEVPGYSGHVFNLDREMDGLINFLHLQGNKKREIDRILKELGKKRDEHLKSSRRSRREDRNFSPPPHGPGTAFLWTDDQLEIDQYLQNGSYMFYNQNDGNLTISHPGGVKSVTGGYYAPGKLLMQDDGNLVQYPADGSKVRFATGTNPNSNAYLYLSNDGKLGVFDGNNRLLWSA